MAAISNIRNPWRIRLMQQAASFRGIMFYVEQGSRNSGRRVVSHEYPKRDTPYAEDMGRQAVRFQFSGYLIHRANKANAMNLEYDQQRFALIDALEDEDAGYLQHPVYCPNAPIWVMCDRYSFTETREKGGYSQFEMSFVEAGTPGNINATINTITNVLNKAIAAEKSFQLPPLSVKG